MKKVHGFIPGTYRDAAAAAAWPFALIHPPENDAFFGIDPPFAKTGVVVDGVGYLITGLAFRHCAGRAELGATFTGHTEIMGAKGNGFIR